MNRAWIACGSMLALALAHGVQATSATDHSKLLFGNWDGLRPSGSGIDFDFGYVSETAHNFSGGKEERTEYTDQWKFGATFDLDRLVDWQGATFQVVITDRNGDDLGAVAEIGNNQLLQEVYGRGQTWHLTIFALEQRWLDGLLDFRIGRLPVGEDIDRFSCDFQNLTFCGTQPGNIVGDYWVNWPTSQWAARLKVSPSATTFVQLAAYQVSSEYVDDSYARHHGLELDFPETDGWLLPLEFGWTPQVRGLPGTYKAGVWYNTAGGDDLFYDVDHQPLALTDGTPRRHDSRYGGYISFKQQLTGEAGGKGWIVALNVAQADADTSATDRQIAFGGEYKGPFGRADDFFGIAVGATHANGRRARYQRLYNESHPDSPGLVRDGNEHVAEMFYSLAPIPGLQIRANVQYVHNPGGTDLHDALVGGMKIVIAF
jgi:porin